MASDQALLETIQRRVEARQEQHLARLGERAVQWLALFPEWSVSLAERSEFPAGGPNGVQAWVETAESLGYCLTGPPTDYGVDPSIRFWMGDDVRTTLVTRWRSQGVDLFAVAQAMRVGVARAVDSGAFSLAPSQQAWLELVKEGSAPRSADFLLVRVRHLLEGGWASQVNALICAGEWFEAVAGAEMASAVRRAKRLLALHYRALHDQEVVRDFHVRGDQVAAFDRLLGSSTTWALHYIGQGGVGKTSLIRYLTAMRGGDGAGPTFARVDFDYVSAEYPWKRPGQLLVELADELDMAVVEADQERLSRAFRSKERRLTEALSGAAQVELHPDSQEMEAAYDAFADFIRQLPQPVVFILDTCEELAKFHPPGAPVESVRFTFEIMERVHARAPDLRVVFAGRRFLADGGAPTPGWEGYDPVQAQAVTGPRPYLDLFEIKGFTTDEATEYLESRTIPGETIEAILKASVTTERTPGLRSSDGPGIRRHSPFEVALYARWALGDSELGAALIDADRGTRYIETRIVSRLEPELRDAIGPVVALGRFNADLLAHALGSKDLADRVFDRLRQQEWTEVATDRTGAVVQVKPTVLGKLRTYLETIGAGSTPGVDSVLSQLKQNLPGHLRKMAVADITASTARAGLCLVAEPDALDLWATIETRILESGEWLSAERLCESLLAPEDEGGLPEAGLPVRAAVAATAAAAAGHLGRVTGPALWSTAAKALDDDPDALGPRLKARIQAGLARDAPLDQAMALLSEVAAAFAATQDGEIVAALCTPLQRVLDDALLAGASLRPLQDLHARLVNSLDARDGWAGWSATSAVDVQLCLLAGRWLDGDRSGDASWNLVAERFAAAERNAPLVASGRSQWLDWQAPASLVDWCRLVWLWSAVRAGRPAAPAPPHTPQVDPVVWCQEAAGRLETVEAERLVSLALDIELAKGVPSNPLVHDLAGRDRYQARPENTLIHRSIPPLFVTQAKALQVLGQPDQGFQILLERAEAATDTRRDALTVDWANSGVLELARVERRDPGSLLDRLALDLHSPLSHRAAMVRLLLRGTGGDPAHLRGLAARLQAPEVAPEELHRIWQLVTSKSRREVAELAAAWIDADARLGGTARPPELALDRREAMTLRGAEARGQGLDAAALRTSPDDVLWGDSPVRTPIRAAALEGRVPDLGGPDRGRRNAELAFEEADILALRLPGAAALLYTAAAKEFRRHGDVGNSSRSLVAAALAQLHESGRLGRGDRRALRSASRALGSRTDYWRAAASFCLGESLPLRATTPELQRAAAARTRRRPPIRLSFQVVFGLVMGALTLLGVVTSPSNDLEAPSGTYNAIATITGLVMLLAGPAWAAMYLLPFRGRWLEWLVWRAEARTERDALTFSIALRRTRLTDRLPAFARVTLRLYFTFVTLGVVALYQAWMTRRRNAQLGHAGWGVRGPVDDLGTDRYRRALRTGRGPIVVEIASDYASEGRELEARLVEWLDPDAVVNARLALLRRSVVRLTDRHARRGSVRRRGVDVLADPAFEPGARRAWAAAGVRRNDGRRGRMASLGTTLHVIGDPRETASGWQMAIGDEYISNVQAKTTTSESVLFGEQNFAVGPAAERHPLRIIVLQPEPCVGMPAIATSAEVMGCRWVARGLAERGHPLVIVLPVVAEVIAVDLVEELARLAGRRPLHGKALVRVDLGLRTWLADRLTAEGVDPATTRAVVYDLGVFTNC